MIEVNALKTQLTITEREQITSGSVNIYQIHFHFSSHWDYLEKIAVFRTPETIINVVVENDSAMIPWEVTTTPGLSIALGVYGIQSDKIILPTIWVNLGTVVEGVFIGDAESGDHTPDIYDILLQKLTDIDEKYQELIDMVDNIQNNTLTIEDVQQMIDQSVGAAIADGY